MSVFHQNVLLREDSNLLALSYATLQYQQDIQATMRPECYIFCEEVVAH